MGSVDASANASADIVVVGKVLVDEIVEDGSLRVSLGGGGPQAAFGAALALPSGTRCLVSAAGDDLLASSELADQLARVGADISGMQFLPFQTPRFRIVIGADEEPEHAEAAGFENWTALLETELQVPAAGSSASTMHVLCEKGGHADLRLARSWKAQSGRAPRSLSIEPVIIKGSPQADYDLVREVVREGDAVSPDWHTACRVAGLDEETDPLPLLSAWADLGPGVVAIRRSRLGSYVLDASSREAWHVPAHRVETVDPTGAGNVYSATFAAQYFVNRRPLLEAACLASAAGAAAVLEKGLPPISDALRTWIRDAAAGLRPNVHRLGRV